MELQEKHTVRVAESLLKQYDPKKRTRQRWVSIALLIFLFLLHAFFSNMENPLKLIPQMFCAMGMGYLTLLILSLKRFPLIAQFIDWEKVKERAR